MGEWTDKAKGRLKKGAGVSAGNKRLQASGAVDETKGRAKAAVERMKRGVKRMFRRSPRG